MPISPGREREEKHQLRRRREGCGGRALGQSQPSSRGDGGTEARGGEGARRRRVESANPSRSCLAFVGLSWTFNVFLINSLRVSKPPQGVYSLAIKWERGISLPPALPGNIPWGLEGGREPPHREQCSYSDSCLDLPFLKSSTCKGKDKLTIPSFPAPLSLA